MLFRSEITDSTTIGSFVTSLQNAGVNASFDEKNQRFFISSKGTGSSETFELRGINAAGMNALDALGISTVNSTDQVYYQSIIDNADSEKEKAITTKLNQLTTQKLDLEGKLEKQTLLLTDTYGELFENIDIIDKVAVQEVIDGLEESNPEAFEELKNWISEIGRAHV